MTLAAWNSSVPRLALEAVLMHSTEERQEVEDGIESLLQFSMAETHISSADSQESIRLPLVASVFGKKKLRISQYKGEIKRDVEMLQMLGPSQGRDVHMGLAQRLEKFISNISDRVDAGESFESYAPVLEMICRAYNPGWLLVARWHMETGTPADYEKAKEELKRYLENAPADADAANAWRMLSRACYQTGDALGEVHAFIERAHIMSVPFSDISATANHLNRVFREQVLDVDRETKSLLAHRLAAVLDKRQNEASADDFSRMAWLALQIGEEAKARQYVKKGMSLEPHNYHCRKIAERLETVG